MAAMFEDLLYFIYWAAGPSIIAIGSGFIAVCILLALFIATLYALRSVKF